MQENSVIYFDNAANTIVDKSVIDSYNKVVEQYIANPSSIHALGQQAEHLLNTARKQILHSFNCIDHDVIFTSGATEANNLAIKGCCLKYQNRGNHIITTSIEHPSVLEAFHQLEKQNGFQVTYLPIHENGVVDIEDLLKAITKNTIFVSIMAVNNETGAINPINEIANILRSYPKIVFHVDAVQAVGKVSLDYSSIDLLSVAGHKIHGLLSSGLLLKRKKIELIPLLSGGGQEYGLRSGTNDVAMAVSLSKAIRLSLIDINNKNEQILLLQRKILDYLRNNPDLFWINSPIDNSPFIINFSLKTAKASVIVEALSNHRIMVSSASACHAHNERKSDVIFQIFKDDKRAHNTIRVSFSNHNNIEEIERFISVLDCLLKGIKK